MRQACAFTGAGNLVSTEGTGTDPATGAVRRAELREHRRGVRRSATTRVAAELPATTDSRGNQISGLPDKPVYANNPSSPNLPPCGTSTLVTFKPGWYDNSETLNNLFRTCANADGSGKDYWFMPGVYYFDFRNTTVTQGRGNVGIDADPGVFDFGDENLAALTHQWCIRGQNVSDGNQQHHRPEAAAHRRRHTVRHRGDRQRRSPLCSRRGSTAGTRCPTRSACSRPANASSSDFTSPNNAKVVDGSSAAASWAGQTTTQTNGTAASSQVVTPGTDDFTAKANATRAINGTVASHTLASVSAAITAAAAASTQVAVARH